MIVSDRSRREDAVRKGLLVDGKHTAPGLRVSAGPLLGARVVLGGQNECARAGAFRYGVEASPYRGGLIPCMIAYTVCKPVQVNM